MMKGNEASPAFSLRQIILMVFIIVVGVEIGGGLYETLVVMPTWAENPPDSVLAYLQHNIANPQFVLNQGGRFWMFFTPLVGLLSIATIISGLKTRREHRRWRLTGAVLVLVVVIFTFAWFVPNIMVLLGEEVTKLSREQVTSLTNWWVRLNWVRVAVYFAGWLTAIRALAIPSARSIES